MKQFLTTFTGFLLLFTVVHINAAERIITLSPSSTEMLFAIGAGEKLIATVEHSDYPKLALSLPHIGNYQSLNVEAILALKPDLIIAWPEGNPAQQLALLEQLGMNIHYSYGKSIDNLGDELESLGIAVGNINQAKTVAKKMRELISGLRNKYKNKSKLSLFYQVWPEPLMSVSNDSWLGESLVICGADNIFADSAQPFPLVSVEKVLLEQPQVILAADKNPKTLDHWLKWPELSAVKNQQLFTIEPDHLHRYGPRLTLGLKELCETLDKARKPKLSKLN